MNRRFFIIFVWCCVICISCSTTEEVNDKDTLFKEIPADFTGIQFTNNLSFDQSFNVYTYRNFYNGGGVALGDVNNDGLIDVYLSGNMSSNKLYLNKGNFQFEDITDRAGVAGKRAWSTGVCMADVNGDGWMDIYVCNSGDIKGDNKQNELFINQGNLTFAEEAEKYNVADRGYSTHAAFFDYDNDGDLDLYILNNSYQSIGSFNLRKNERPNRDPLGGHKLMRNDGDHYSDVSVEAGIYGSVIAFGLGVTVGDVNKDGWQDIYVSNDFFERDYLYINNKNGTFKECLTDEMKSISGASMGADLADINNDTYPDIFVTEMLPSDNKRLKTVTTFENWDRYQYNIQNGYYHQFTRNMLQLNNGNGTFSEVGRLAGVEATDWSWGALMFDMDNDGLKDIFVANGIYQDLTNQDYLQYISNEEVVKSIVSGKGVDYKKLVELIPSNPIPNFAFHNLGNLNFKDEAKNWGLSKPDFSNGTAYGDLDNDGDLDLVINNVNQQASVYRNESNSMLPDHHFLKFELKGIGKNTSAFGTKITIKHKGLTIYTEQMPIRGFESSMDHRPNVGVGKNDTIDYVLIQWPDGKINELKNIATNQVLHLNQKDAVDKEATVVLSDISPRKVFERDESIISFVHHENDFVDFDRDFLIYHMLSSEGPRMSKGDVNGDGKEDFYIGGSKGFAGALQVQNAHGGFVSTNEKVLEADRESEDSGSAFFDADGDGDIDLLVCSGGNEFSSSSSALVSRLYFNDGKGNFTRSPQLLPTSVFESASVVKHADYDLDGDEDLFIGIRLKPFQYGIPVSGYILNNDGKGNFKNVSDLVAPGLKDVGMITDAIWTDIDGDKDNDLVIVGEYMPVRIFLNDKGKLIDKTDESGLSKSNGWWNNIQSADIDHDGDMDFVLGNHGLNSRFRASVSKPVSLYTSDFDQNGTIEHVVTLYNGEKSYPLALRHDLVSKIPSLKKKYLKYENYNDQTIEDIFTKDQLASATRMDAYELASCVAINQGNGKFNLQRLPIEAQYSPIYGLLVADFNGDGHMDILAGGNLYKTKPEVGRYDASYGVFLTGDGKGNFNFVSDSGFSVDGEVRGILPLIVKGSEVIMVSRNNDSILSFKLKK